MIPFFNGPKRPISHCAALLIILCTCMHHTVCRFCILSTTQFVFPLSGLVLPFYQISTFDLNLFGSSKRYNSYVAVLMTCSNS